MPKFEVVPVDEAMKKSSTGKRALLTREYVGYIEQLAPGQAGRLDVVSGETIGAIRRRLGTAAKSLGKDLAIRRAGHSIFFWLKGQEATAPRRRGRPRKVAP